MKPLSISVIIPTYNRPQVLSQALETLLRQTYPVMEVLIIDQSSGPQTRTLVQGFSVRAPNITFRYFHMQKRSSAIARNVGIDNASGDVLSFLDDDVELDPGYYDVVMRFFLEHEDVGGVGGIIKNLPVFTSWKWMVRKILMRLFLIDFADGRLTPSGFGYPVARVASGTHRELELLSGGSMSFRREAIGATRFDHFFCGYSYREDVDFSFEIAKRSRIFLLSQAQLYHHEHPTNRMDVFTLREMQLKNYFFVFKKQCRKNALSRVFFCYSILGLCVLDMLDFLWGFKNDDFRRLQADALFLKLLAANSVLGRQSQRKTRVLHLIKTLHLGGAETNLFNLVSQLDKNRFETHVGYCFGGEIEKRFRGINDIRLFVYARRSYRLRDLPSIAIVVRIYFYLVRHKIQVVHCHSFNASVWGGIAARLAGCKIVEHVHDQRFCDPAHIRVCHGEFPAQYRWRSVLRFLSDRTIVLTKETMEQIIRQRIHEPGTVMELFNGVPINDHPVISAGEAQEDIRKTLSLRTGSRIILTAARLDAPKNIGLLIYCMADIMRKIPEAHLLIAGCGPQLDNLKQTAETCGVASNVRFLGFYDRISDLLMISDIFALPSLIELHSISIIEALEAKVPVLASAGVGSNNEFIMSGENGFLLNPCSARAWSDTIITLLQDEPLRRSIGEKGFQTCRERFNISDVAQQIEKVYAELAGA